MGYDSPRDEILSHKRMESGFKSCSRKLSKSSDCRHNSNKANAMKTARRSDEAKYTYGKAMHKFYWNLVFFQLGFTRHWEVERAKMREFSKSYNGKPSTYLFRTLLPTITVWTIIYVGSDPTTGAIMPAGRLCLSFRESNTIVYMLIWKARQ